jgi:hypothetical protein
MGFRFRGCFGAVTIVLLCGCMSSSAAERSSMITVLVNDSVHIDRQVLGEAEKEAARIFHAGGVEISWVNCIGGSDVGRCRVQPGVNEFVVHIVMSGKTSSDSVFGVAFVAEDGSGKYCDVFFRRIKQQSEESNLGVERLLGYVISHELGHLLLGSRSHSPWGIMMPTWRNAELQEAKMGMLLFHQEQAQLMRTRIDSAAKLARPGDAAEMTIGRTFGLRR